MADEIDRAQAREEMDRQLAIAAFSGRVFLPAKGGCYNCEETLHDDQRFCDADCRDDYDARQGRGGR